VLSKMIAAEQVSRSMTGAAASGPANPVSSTGPAVANPAPSGS
jgi:hypothetical protein